MQTVEIEQYVHCLIAAESDFVPKPIHVAEFFQVLVTSFGFRLNSDPQSFLKFRVRTSSGKRRTSTNAYTGETWSFPVYDRVEADAIRDLASAIERLEDYRVFVPGEWEMGNRPLTLMPPDGAPYNGKYLCEVSCHLRCGSVPMSCAPTNPDPPKIDRPYHATETTQILFSNPLTGAKMTVPSVACSRFWIEFEFGKFLLPEITASLDILSPAIVTRTEECLQTRFVQGWSFR
jgi:hypothetical protein